jgi:hypothetical protein
MLRDGRGAGRGLTLQGVASGRQRARPEHPADAKPSHGEALAHAVDDDDALAQIGRDLKQRVLLKALVHEGRVDLVDDDPERVRAAHLRQRRQLGSRIRRPGGVVRCAQEQGPRALGERIAQALRGELEVGLGQRLHQHRRRPESRHWSG